MNCFKLFNALNTSMEIEELLLKTIPKDELERQIEAKVKSFFGLLTREAAMRLIAKDNGLLKEEEKEYPTLADIPDGAKRFGFQAQVKKIWPIAEYSSGKRSRVVEIKDLGDEGKVDESKGDGLTTKPLILWNDDIALSKGLRARDHILVKGAYERGGEIHLGYSGKLDIVKKAGFSDLEALEDGTSVHVAGVIGRIEGHDSFVSNGRTRRGFSFFLSDGKSERRCIIFEMPERGERLKAGDEAIIENADVHKGTIEIGPDSRCLSRRKSAMLLGEVESIGCVEAKRTGGKDEGGKNSEGDMMVMRIIGREKEALLDRKNALKLMGVSIAPDITLGTVIALKKGEILNSRLALRIEEKEGRIIVV